jgi:hypothetical protein
MSAALETQTSGIQETPRPEVVHFAAADIVINHQAAEGAPIDELIDQFKDGEIPDTWTPGFSDNHGTAEIAGRKFFAKVKIASGKLNYESLKELKQQQAEEVQLSVEGLESEIARLKRANSVLSEIRLSGTIERIMGSEDAQKIARDYGFNGVGFKGPILSVTDRRSGRKSMVYDYIEGETLADMDLSGREQALDKDQKKQLAEAFRTFLHENGVEASDIDSRQFIVDKEGSLHLIDTEQYAKVA